MVLSDGVSRHPKIASPFDIVLLAASSGGLAACKETLAALPADFPAGVVVTLHRSRLPSGVDLVPEIFGMRTALPVEPASDGLPLRPGVVYVTPPSDQMVIAPERAFRSIERPLARGTSCLAGPLFTSAAAVYGKRVLAVVLTGTGADGADSLLDVKRAGGRIIVQDPATAHSAGMPRAAVATGLADFVLPLDAIGPLLTAFAMTAGAARFLAVRSPSWAQSIPVASRTVAPPA